MVSDPLARKLKAIDLIDVLPDLFILRAVSAHMQLVDALGGGALHIGARFVVRTSSILNWNVQFLRSLRRRVVFAWGESIAIEPRVLPEPERDWKRIDIEHAAG
jgi:hypothetical protein